MGEWHFNFLPSCGPESGAWNLVLQACAYINQCVGGIGQDRLARPKMLKVTKRWKIPFMCGWKSCGKMKYDSFWLLSLI